MRTPVTLALFLTLLLLLQFLFSQRTLTISGKLISAKDNSPVIYTHLYIPNTTLGTYSNDDEVFLCFAHIYKNGYINDGTDMIVEGYFGLEKIADMLPLDYKE